MESSEVQKWTNHYNKAGLCLGILNLSLIIGAGGIVNDGQMPAYRKANFHVQGIFDINQENAQKTADRWQIETIYPSLNQATQFTDVVYDLLLYL